MRNGVIWENGDMGLIFIYYFKMVTGKTVKGVGER